MPRRLPLIAGLCFLGPCLLSSGCSTIQSLSTNGDYYGGARADFTYFGEPQYYDENVAIFGLIDLPFSLIADTLVLPVQFFTYSRTVGDRQDDETEEARVEAPPQSTSSDKLASR